MDVPLPHHFATAHSLDANLFHPQLHHGHPSLTAQNDFDTDPFQFTSPLDHQPQLQLQHPVAFDQRRPIPPPRFQELPSNVPGPDSLNNDFTRNSTQPGQFGILTPHPQIANQPHIHHEVLGRLQNEIDLRPVAVQDGGTTEGHFSNMKIVPNPPDLDAWRTKLFDVDDTLTLTEDQFQTYFPHIDNVYSHRSTQKYKRKPLVSHYFDCRMKGRPPGTAKSEDPNKKKRKRQARERDLCDVKIKITEYFPGARRILGKDAPAPPVADPSNVSDQDFFSTVQTGNVMQGLQHARQFPFIAPNDGSMGGEGMMRLTQSSADARRFYTIQRVNGNGANGKNDGSAGPHKHSLEDSDRIKKNSVLRHMLKVEKEKKKTEIMADDTKSNQKTYHKKATGEALVTAKKHSKDHELKLYGSCFCPFVQRVWISLQFKGLAYQYIEIDPYKKPESLLAINPRGLVPALKHGEWGCYESTVLMEYLEDISNSYPLFPPGDAKLRAQCRLWTDHVNRHIVPAFYNYLQAQEIAMQMENASRLQNEISKLIEVAHPSGPYFLGTEMSYVDVQIAPWIIRMRRVLTPYRGWPEPEAGSRWASWVDAIENNPHVKATTSTDDLYLDSYERYAENRPDTSQVANAVNEGRGLP
ncbi:MAG: hypothetical protein LQ339_004016 [Xanthoria mediterranea]|nr:MAG: hypothetical protein LQ339_004016 [Xanthoria mediterranea]